MRRNSQQKEELKVNTANIEYVVSAAFTPREYNILISNLCVYVLNTAEKHCIAEKGCL